MVCNVFTLSLHDFSCANNSTNEVPIVIFEIQVILSCFVFLVFKNASNLV